jgi:hypothetical protein
VQHVSAKLRRTAVTSDEAVLHGYTMDQIDRLADRVVSAGRKWLIDQGRHMQKVGRAYGGSIAAEARECAWEGIVTLLCEADERPSELALRAAGWHSVKADRREKGSLAGWTHGHEGYSVQFETYWQSHAMPANFEEVLVDTIGFQQAWASLRQYHRDTFEAFAQAGYRQGACAAILGCDKRAVRRRLTLGYEAFAALWFGSESAPPRARDAFERPDATDPNRPNSIQNIAWRAVA